MSEIFIVLNKKDVQKEQGMGEDTNSAIGERSRGEGEKQHIFCFLKAVRIIGLPPNKHLSKVLSLILTSDGGQQEGGRPSKT